MQTYQGANVAVVPSPQGYCNAAVDGDDVDNYQLPPNITVASLTMYGVDASGQESVRPLTIMDDIHGYDNVTFDGVPLAPPSYDDAIRDEEPCDRPQVSTVVVISEEEARAALLQHCTMLCCYGRRAARDMNVTDMASILAYHYILESFGEARSTAWNYSVYRGGLVDGPANGPSPEPWSIAAYATEKFKNETRKLEVPHTASVKPCHECEGVGRVRCRSCSGLGRSSCQMCTNGYTTLFDERRLCSSCSGSGYSVCYTCNGHGHVHCGVCKGCGKLKWFIELTVVWRNHIDDFILNASAMPDKKIRKGTGVTAFEEEHSWVVPLNHCPEAAINEASTELVNKHRTHFTNEKILIQRHRVRIVPVTAVGALWKEKPFKFFVYGLEHRVYTMDYPQRCCCGCSLL